MTLVTFVVPTIGRDTLERALHSLYRQTIWDWKAIVIFDGIDPTIEVTDPRITVMKCEKAGTSEIVNGQERNNGAGEVRNIAIRACDTEWIAFLDDDDTIAYTYLETFYNEIDLVDNVDAVVFRMRHPEYGVHPTPSSVHFVQYEVGISFLLKRRIFQEGTWFVPSHDEDYNLLCSVREKGYKMVMSPYVKYFVHDHAHTELDSEKGRRILINPGK